MRDLTGLQRDILFTVAGLDCPRGVEVKTKLESYYCREVKSGQLYPNLNALVEKGFVEKSSHDRRSNTYELTGKGSDCLRDRYEWEQTVLTQGDSGSRNVTLSG